MGVAAKDFFKPLKQARIPASPPTQHLQPSPSMLSGIFPPFPFPLSTPPTPPHLLQLLSTADPGELQSHSCPIPTVLHMKQDSAMDSNSGSKLAAPLRACSWAVRKYPRRLDKLNNPTQSCPHCLFLAEHNPHSGLSLELFLSPRSMGGRGSGRQGNSEEKGRESAAEHRREERRDSYLIWRLKKSPLLLLQCGLKGGLTMPLYSL